MNTNLIHTLFGLCLITCTVIMSSCGEEDNNDITGTYQLTEVSSSGCNDSSDNVSFNLSGDGCQALQGEEICISGSMSLTGTEFSSSLTISSTGESETITNIGTYTIEGNMITICSSDDCDVSTFSLRNDQLSIMFPEDDFGCRITYTGRK